jgi:hypothetical protein
MVSITFCHWGLHLFVNCFLFTVQPGLSRGLLTNSTENKHTRKKSDSGVYRLNPATILYIGQTFFSQDPGYPRSGQQHTHTQQRKNYPIKLSCLTKGLTEIKS